MPYHIVPLRYAVDNWLQAQGARSNTDPTLRIKVSQFVNSDILQGQRIEVLHPQYGVLFACLVNSTGRLVSSTESPMLTTAEITQALAKLGFDITFKINPQLSTATREFLAAAKVDGYTHVRWALVTSTKSVAIHRLRVICFNENKNPELLRQFLGPITIRGGNVMVVSPNDNPNLDFSWLEVPMEIESVLTDNL